MSLDAGDLAYRHGQTIALDAGDNEVSGGEAVTFDAEGYIDTAGDGDFVVGTISPAEVGEDADNRHAVHVAGLPVVVETDAAVDNGDHLEAAAGGVYSAAADPGNDSALPFVVEAVDESENLYVAVFR